MVPILRGGGWRLFSLIWREIVPAFRKLQIPKEEEAAGTWRIGMQSRPQTEKCGQWALGPHQSKINGGGWNEGPNNQLLLVGAESSEPELDLEGRRSDQ